MKKDGRHHETLAPKAEANLWTVKHLGDGRITDKTLGNMCYKPFVQAC